jgi:hypothetical protein
MRLIVKSATYRLQGVDSISLHNPQIDGLLTAAESGGAGGM